MEIRSRYSEQVRVKQASGGPSRTKQSFKAECDINNILKKFRDTGVVTHVRKSAGLFADFSGLTDYQTALNAVLSADAAFKELPASVRDRFGNNPTAFLRFVEDDKNEDELISMGLAERRPPPKETTPTGDTTTETAKAVATESTTPSVSK